MAEQVVRLGSREIAVEQAPLRPRFRTHHGFRMHGFRRHGFRMLPPEDSELRLMPSRAARVMGWVCGVLGWRRDTAMS